MFVRTLHNVFHRLIDGRGLGYNVTNEEKSPIYLKTLKYLWGWTITSKYWILRTEIHRKIKSIIDKQFLKDYWYKISNAVRMLKNGETLTHMTMPSSICWDPYRSRHWKNKRLEPKKLLWTWAWERWVLCWEVLEKKRITNDLESFLRGLLN